MSLLIRTLVDELDVSSLVSASENSHCLDEFLDALAPPERASAFVSGLESLVSLMSSCSLV